MSERKKKSHNFIKRLRKHYRLVIMNDDNFEIKTSLKLNPLNVLFIVSTLFVAFALIIILLMKFTPVKELFFGPDTTPEMRRQLVNVNSQVDSLQMVVYSQENFISSITSVLRGDIDTSRQSYSPEDVAYDSVNLGRISRQDSVLRQEYQEKRKYGILTTNRQDQVDAIEELHFFPPLQGIVTNEFDTEYNHYGIDIVAKDDSPVKSVLDGKVIFTGWTSEFGNIMAIQHIDNIVSIYKHNSVLLKKVGNFVQAGDVVALIGDTGEFSQGPHLHFELWHDMVPVNPLQYIVFNS